MAKVMKLVGEDGALVQVPRGTNPREVQDCFVKSYKEMGWVEVKPVVDDRPNPEFMSVFKSGVRPQHGQGPRFTAGPNEAASEPGKVTPKGKTAKERQAEAASEPGKE